MPRTGIEPVTRGFSVLCSTNWAIWAKSEKTIRKANVILRIAGCLHTCNSRKKHERFCEHLRANVHPTNAKHLADGRIGFRPQLTSSRSGGRIWTYDLRVMSPTSFQTALPRVNKIMGRGGFEPPKALPADLQSVPFGHSGICPWSKQLWNCQDSWGL